MKHSNVTVSIVTHTAFEQCKRTLEAILPTLEGATLILTANGNVEAARYFSAFSALSENVKTFANPNNLGFIEPSNRAFDKCQTPLFVLLNDDAIPPADWLDKLKAAFDHDKVAITGPGDRWLNKDFIGHRWRGGLPLMPDYIEGSCMMVRTSTLSDNKEPLFWDELKIAYCEDADLSLRVRKLGYTLAVADFTLIHKAGTTTRTVPELHDTIRGNFVKCRDKWRHYLKTRTFA